MNVTKDLVYGKENLQPKVRWVELEDVDLNGKTSWGCRLGAESNFKE